MASVNQDFVTYAGDSVAPIFTVTNASGVAVDISTVSQITWTVRRNLTESALVTKTKTSGAITFVNTGTDGKFQVAVTTSDTSSLSGYYIHEATITDASGNVTTVTVGRMQVALEPAWTYDSSQLKSEPVYQVRLLIGDVLQGDQQMTDDEIAWNNTQFSNVYLSAAQCARMLSGRMSREVDLVQGELKTNYSNKARAYYRLAIDLEQRGMARGGATGYAGGISQQDKQSQEDNTDRVQPQFNVGMMDNLLPVGPVGHETPGSPETEFGGEDLP